jgi:gliding motility-associated lipoprotein GldD
MRKNNSGYLSKMAGIFALSLGLSACTEDFTPRPRGYFQLDFPERAYRTYDNSACPCTFEYPVYADIEQEEHFFDDKPEHPCWLNVNFPTYNATIYLSYKDVSSRARFEQVLGDSYKMTYKHSGKAEYIDESMIEVPGKDIFGYVFEVGGDAASGVQFFVTDSTQHFLRGALYFKVSPNSDSLQPAIEFFQKDMMHLIETLEWR